MGSDGRRLQWLWTADCFVEDQLSLRTSVRRADTSLEQPLDGRVPDERNRSDWSFGLELVYPHDGILR